MTLGALEVRQGWRIVGSIIRCVLLAALFWGALVAVLSLHPVPRTRADFRAAAADGRVTLVEYKGREGDLYHVRWTEGPLTWRWISPRPLVDDAIAYTRDDLGRDLGNRAVRVTEIEDDADRGAFPPRWPFDVPGPTVGWVAAAWVLTFLIMMGSTPRLGNRWAWFWMFTVGQVGAILFLLLEPRRPWFREAAPSTPRGRLGGGFGFLTAVGVGMITVGVTILLGWLVHLAVG